VTIRIPARARAGRGVPAERFWALSAACLLFAYLSLDNRFLRDYWQHLAVARHAAAAGEWYPARDALTYTVEGERRANPDWLAQRFFLWAHETGGLALARTLNAVAVLAGFVLLGRAAWSRAGRREGLAVPLAASAAALLCALQSLTLRPQTFSLLTACAIVAALELSRCRPAARWSLAPLMALWANLHAAFALGWILILIDRWERRRAAGIRLSAAPAAAPPAAPIAASRLPGLAADLLSLAAPLANPEGWRILAHLARNAARSRARAVAEWAAPALDQPAGFFLALTPAATLVLFWRAGRRERGRMDLLPPAVRFAILGVPAALSARMVAWFGIGMAPVWAALLAREAEERRPPSGDGGAAPQGRRLDRSLLVVPLLMAVSSLPWFREAAGWLPEERRPLHAGRPVAAIDHLCGASRAARVWAPFDWAGYVEWVCPPGTKVFADGRVDLFPDPIWDDYLEIERGGERTLALLDATATEAVIVDRARFPRLEFLLGGSPAWRAGYSDGGAAVFVRAEP
jgi:hypothetical protein